MDFHYITIYHGSNHEIIKPTLHGSKRNNDYGYGFYCTEEIELANEWAAKNKDKAYYTNEYALDMKDLSVLDLTDKKYSILNWISILLKNRFFMIDEQLPKKAKEFLIDNFYIDTTKYDVIIGYRADDSYFKYALAFINNTLSVKQLEKAMRLGNLGKQIVIVSEHGLDNLYFIKKHDVHPYYHSIYQERDTKARNKYNKLSEEELEKDDKFILEIMKEYNNGTL